MSTLLAWVLAASATLAPQRSHERLATAIASRVEAEAPLFKGDDDRKKTSALLVAMAFRESSLRPDAVGDHVAGKPTSFCAFQVHLPWGKKTAEGWSGPDLVEDPEKCVSAALSLVRMSMRACPDHPIAVYASGPLGCANSRAQRISRDRLAIAQRLVRDVRVTEPATEETASPGPLPTPSAPFAPNDPTGVAIDPATSRPRRSCSGA